MDYSIPSRPARWQVLKNGIPVGMYPNFDEAEQAYMDFNADEIVLHVYEEPEPRLVEINFKVASPDPEER